MIDKVFIACVLLSIVYCGTVPIPVAEYTNAQQIESGSSSLKDTNGNVISPPAGHIDDDKKSEDAFSKDLLPNEDRQADRSKRWISSDTRRRIRNYFRRLVRGDDQDGVNNRNRNGTRVIHSYRKEGRIGNIGHYSFSVQASVHDSEEVDQDRTTNSLPTGETEADNNEISVTSV